MGIKVGVLGATGYTGAELLRFLINHSGVEISWLTSEKFSGSGINEVFSQFRSFIDVRCVSIRRLSEVEKVDLVFSCLPHGIFMQFVGNVLEKGLRVVDLSSDFRLNDPRYYESCYGIGHKNPELLRETVYGLPEIHRADIREARLVANPGCFSTGIILGLAPLFKHKQVKGYSAIADVKSGLTGGGRAPAPWQHFPESNESVSTYGVVGHDQKYEVENELSSISGSNVNITLVPHNIPLNRGILATIYIHLNQAATSDEIHDLYDRFYEKEKFVRIYEWGEFPEVKSVRYSNLLDIGIGFQDDVVVIVTSLDNLGKGASGQAVQNMNIMFGFPEERGLELSGIYP